MSLKKFIFAFGLTAILMGCGEESKFYPKVQMSAGEFTAGRATNLGEAEAWGRWTTGTPFTFKFNQSLPSNFRLIITPTQAFGPNVGKNFAVTIGGQTTTGGQTQNFVGPSGASTGASQPIILEFKNIPSGSDLLSMTIPEPSIADPINPRGDKRLLGLGMVTLEIAPLK
jgi:hypothetical protein